MLNRKKYAHLDSLSEEGVKEYKQKGKEKEREQFVLEAVARVGKADLSTLETLGTKNAAMDFINRGKIVKKVTKEKTIVAKGDSWFDYGIAADIVDALRNEHDYIVDNFSEGGDTLENMIYGTEYDKSSFRRKTPDIERVLKRVEKLKPKIFLFSGGGNDIAGEEFESYLNHKHSGLPGVRTAYVDYMIKKVFKKYIEHLISRVKKVSPQTHIIMHGYGYAVPTGKPARLFRLIRVAGPWLRSALVRKGIEKKKEQKDAVRVLIDAYNKMLKSMDNQYANFHHIDLRKEIGEIDWRDELHLESSAFAAVSDIFVKKIDEIYKK